MPRPRRVGLGLAVLSLLVSAPLAAQQAEASKTHSGLGFGVKAGLGISPDQFVLGAQVSLGKSLGVFRLVPNVHLGLGDFTSWDFNADFLVRLIVQDSGFGLYGGAAPTLAIMDDNTEFGGTLVVGTQLPIFRGHATNIEARFGLGDVPDFRLLLAIIF